MPFVLKGNYDKPAGAVGKLKAAKHEGITDVVVIFHFLSGIILVGPALCHICFVVGTCFNECKICFKFGLFVIQFPF